jgi:hypothetical protein
MLTMTRMASAPSPVSTTESSGTKARLRVSEFSTASRIRTRTTKSAEDQEARRDRQTVPSPRKRAKALKATCSTRWRVSRTVSGRPSDAAGAAALRCRARPGSEPRSPCRGRDSTRRSDRSSDLAERANRGIPADEAAALGAGKPVDLIALREWLVANGVAQLQIQPAVLPEPGPDPTDLNLHQDGQRTPFSSASSASG